MIKLHTLLNGTLAIKTIFIFCTHISNANCFRFLKISTEPTNCFTLILWPNTSRSCVFLLKEDSTVFSTRSSCTVQKILLERKVKRRMVISVIEWLIMHQHRYFLCDFLQEFCTVELSHSHNGNQIKRSPTYKTYPQLYLASEHPPNVESSAKAICNRNV